MQNTVMRTDHSVVRKRKSPPPMDVLSRPDKEQKRQQVIVGQGIRAPSAVDEEFASPILDANKDSSLCEDSDIGSGDPPSAEVPKHLDRSQRTRPLTTLFNIPVPRWLKGGKCRK